jgi:hypothetical protein
MKFIKGETVSVTAVAGDMFHDFTGNVVGFSPEGFVLVKDQDGDVWECDEDQLELSTED